jgi:4-carboxymuconolactone decarboxylase
MPRIQIADRAAMSDEQRRVYDETLAGPRGHIPPPLTAWLASPELAQRAQHLGAFARYQTSLPPRLSEIAILVTARHWTSHFEWYAHKKEALAAGVDPAVIEAIAGRRPPPFAGDDERLIYEVARSVHERHGVPDELYRASVAALGERAVVELVGILGYYTLVAMTLNTFELGLPDGVAPELD